MADYPPTPHSPPVASSRNIQKSPDQYFSREYFRNNIFEAPGYPQPGSRPIFCAAVIWNIFEAPAMTTLHGTTTTAVMVHRDARDREAENRRRARAQLLSLVVFGRLVVPAFLIFLDRLDGIVC